MPVYNFNRGFTILHASLFELEFFRAYYILFFFLIIILVNADIELDIIYDRRLEAEFRVRFIGDIRDPYRDTKMFINDY